MGNQPSVQAIVQTITLPKQKNPVQDGASGLHYSGKMYMNSTNAMTTNICPGGAVPYSVVDEKFPNGVATDTLPVDASTKRISTNALQGYVNNLINTNVIPAQTGSITAQIAADKVFYANIQAEYCFYEARYIAALTQFITEISAKNGGTGDRPLQKTVSLNKKLNSIMEILSYIGNDRARKVNVRSEDINKANVAVDTKLAQLQAQQKYLESTNVRLETQTEMMRYSKEKNSAMNIQVMFFIALNVVAIGTVFTVYTRLKPGV